MGQSNSGTSTGHFLHIFRERYNKKIIGYDFTNSAIKKLKEKNIPARQIDLNSIDQEQNTLSYKRELDEDLANPTNILLIRILNHLDFNAMNLLLSYIIIHSKPGSVIFIAGDINKRYGGKYSGLTKNYKASFFAPRTDMEFLRLENTPKTSISPHQNHLENEVLVVRKRN